jgi:hypothetical protein
LNRKLLRASAFTSFLPAFGATAVVALLIGHPTTPVGAITTWVTTTLIVAWCDRP